MAAGTAAALVPIRSITRKSTNDKFSYLPEGSDEPGPIFNKMIAALKGIQLGKIKGPEGWCVPVTEVDIKKYSSAESKNGVDGIKESVDELV